MAKSNGDGISRKRTPKSPTVKAEQPRTAAGIPATKADGPQNVTTLRPRLSHEELNEAIRRRAYELYCERGQQGGSPEEDWQRAEQEILSKYSQRTA